MKHKNYILLLLAMIMALPMVTACNEDDDHIDYTKYYDWRDENNTITELLWKIYESDSAHTYFDNTVMSLKEPTSYPTYVHYFRHANLDSLSNLSPRKDYRPFSTSTLSVHYTLYKTSSVYDKVKQLGGWSQDLMRNNNGAIDSIFFANAIDNTLKADTIESNQVKFYTDFTPNSVITGWGDVLQEMYIGDNVVVMIPWFLAYGQAGSGSSIDPYSNLFFRIELCDITNWGATVK